MVRLLLLLYLNGDLFMTRSYGSWSQFPVIMYGGGGILDLTIVWIMLTRPPRVGGSNALTTSCFYIKVKGHCQEQELGTDLCQSLC